MSRKENDKIDKYLRYAKDMHGVPDDYEDWAVDNNITLPSKKKNSTKENYDDPE